MSRQDMVWEKLPEYWYESAYLGNGRLGLMIYKEPGKNYLRLETGNCDVHDHRVQRDVFGIPRLLTGYFALHPKGEIISGKMRLDLWNAEASTDIITTKGIIHLQTFVHANDMVIAIKATTEGEEHDFKWEWVAELQHLKQIVLPVTRRNVASGTERFKFLIPFSGYFRRIVSTKNINQHSCADLLFCACDGT